MGIQRRSQQLVNAHSRWSIFAKVLETGRDHSEVTIYYCGRSDREGTAPESHNHEDARDGSSH